MLMRRWLLLLFLATMAINWPQLPFNMRATDLVFVAAALAIVATARPWTWPRLSALDYTVAAYIGGSVIATALSPDVRVSSVELVRHLYVVSIYIVIAVAVRHGLAHTVGTGLALSGGLLAALGVAATVLLMISGIRIDAIGRIATLPYLGDTLRVQALTASESMLACALAVSAPFVLLHPVIRSSWLRINVAAMVLLVAALLTFSHSVAGIAVAVLIATWPWLRTAALRSAAAAAVILMVLAANFAATVSIRSVGGSPRDNSNYEYGVDSGRAEIAGVNVEYQTMSYLRLKQVAWDTFAGRPLTGIGLDRFHSATEAAYQGGRLTEHYRAADPHSSIPGRLAETGIPGAITMLALWCVAGIETMRL
ncbi:MAG TPA: O-antigen ligase family protein, partial [Vicinamibacterales bacterium]